MRPLKAPLQFSLLHLFGWVLAVSLLFAAARLPWPINGYIAPLYAAFLAGAISSNHPWLAAAGGGIAGSMTSYLLAIAEVGQVPNHIPPGSSLFPWYAVCCCSPLGASVGLATGLALQDFRNRRRFRARLTTVASQTPPPRLPIDPRAEV